MNIFSVLRVDNKVAVYKYTGERVFLEKVGGPLYSVAVALAGDAAVTDVDAAEYTKAVARRALASPVRNKAAVVEAPQAWRPRNHSAAAAALLARPTTTGFAVGAAGAAGATGARAPVGAVPAKVPLGANLVVQKKKR
jgi:hypothetical protein